MKVSSKSSEINVSHKKDHLNINYLKSMNCFICINYLYTEKYNSTTLLSLVCSQLEYTIMQTRPQLICISKKYVEPV